MGGKLGKQRSHHRRLTEVFRGKIFTVTRRRFQKGGKVFFIDTIEHSSSSVVLPMRDPRTVLLIRQFRPAIGREIWEVPAGTLEAGESPLQCARREMEEEAGYRAGRMRRLAVFYPSPGFCTEKMHLFLAERLTPLPQRLEPDEQIRVHPVSVTRALRLLREGRILDAKTIIALLFLHTAAGTSQRVKR